MAEPQDALLISIMNDVTVRFKSANSTRFLSEPEARWREETAGLDFSDICNLSDKATGSNL